MECAAFPPMANVMRFPCKHRFLPMQSITVRITLFVIAPMAFALGVAVVLVQILQLEMGTMGALAISLLALVSAVAGTVTSIQCFVAKPLKSLAGQIRRASKDSFLLRASKDDQARELADVAEAFNGTLSEITTMQVAAIETEQQVKQLEGELALKEQLESRNREVEQANARLEQRVKEMSMLLDVSRQLGSTLELPEILRSITDIVGNAMGADQFTIMLLEPGDVLRVAGCYGLNADSLTSFTLRMGEGASGIAAQTREPVYIEDVRNDPRYIRGPQDPDTDSSLLCVPMVCRDRFVGILNFTRLRKDAFTNDDIVLLQLMGAQAAMAVLNAQLFGAMDSAQAQNP